MNPRELVLHGLAIKKQGTAEDLAGITGLAPAIIADHLAAAAETGRASKVDGKYVLSALGRIALEADYSRLFGPARANAAFMAAYEAFETNNVDLKTLITDWQMIEVGGRHITNDHSDRDHDAEIIDRLGGLHERVDPILARIATDVPRLEYYRESLERALERAEEGAIEWVSDVRIESYHTLWFELHEELLRIAGRSRKE